MTGEQSMNIIETSGLGKRYGSTWALRECSLAIPAGHVAALVGQDPGQDRPGAVRVVVRMVVEKATGYAA